MNAKELEGDLTTIEKAVERSTADATTKRLLGEMIEWSRGLVKVVAAGGTNAKLVERVDALESDVGTLMDDAEEGIYEETAQEIIAAFQQASMVNAAVTAMIAGGTSGLDDVTAKKFSQLIKASETAIVGAVALIAEITIPDEEKAAGGAKDEEDEDEEDEEDDEDEEDEENEASDEDAEENA